MEKIEHYGTTLKKIQVNRNTYHFCEKKIMLTIIYIDIYV